VSPSKVSPLRALRPNNGRIVPRLVRTVYTDPQNVHVLTGETIRIALLILEDQKATYQGRPFDHPFFDNIELADTYQGLSVVDLFASIYHYIQNSFHRDELMKRLHEELNEAVGTCLSGHVSRLINSLRGFSNGRYDIQMDSFEEDKARLYHELNQRLNWQTVDTGIHQVQEIINSGQVHLPETEITLRILSEYTQCQWRFRKARYEVRP